MVGVSAINPCRDMEFNVWYGSLEGQHCLSQAFRASSFPIISIQTYGTHHNDGVIGNDLWRVLEVL